jgi:uncharacterized damage-inducible protein DinB
VVERFPAIEPFDQGMVYVGDAQLVYWETSGNPDGNPAVVLHGGPGGASSPSRRRLFDPVRRPGRMGRPGIACGGSGMGSAEILVDAFDRIRGVVHGAVDGLTPDQLAFRVDSRVNSIGWLVWHLTRIQDDHIADAAQVEQLWTAGGQDEVAAVRVPSGDLLTGYHDAVHDQTVEYVRGLTDRDLTRIVDESWTPPVSLAVRLVSVISDDLQHAGQAAFVRGLLQRRPAV